MSVDEVSVEARQPSIHHRPLKPSRHLKLQLHLPRPPVAAPASKARANANKPRVPKAVPDMLHQPSNAEIMAIVTQLSRQMSILT
jgi:hypothetical protein